MRIRHAECTDRGKVRETNEDAIFSCVPREELLEKKGALFVVGDGLGGLARGEVASLTAVRWVRDFFMSPVFFPRGPEWLRAAFLGANRRIREENLTRYRGEPMATTLTASWFRAERLHAAHVGDCRIYLFRNGGTAVLTTDHATSRTTLTRVVGLDAELAVDIIESDVLEGDCFVQCSDGLYPLVPEPEMAEVIGTCGPVEACRRFVALANDRGGPDNISVQIVRFDA